MCLASCRSCLNALTCTRCYSSQVLLRNGSCMDHCGLGEYSDSQLCKSCSDNCLSCETLPTLCKSCRSGYLLTWNNSCRAEYLLEEGELVYIGVVVKCMGSCRTCRGTPRTCLSCYPQFYLINGNCVRTVPAGYYILNSEAYQCHENCQSCSGSPTNCTTCRKDSRVPYLVNGLCLPQCPLTHYTVGLQCFPCSVSCLGCVVNRPEECLSCRSRLVLVNGKCRSTSTTTTTTTTTTTININSSINATTSQTSLIYGSNCLKWNGDRC